MKESYKVKQNIWAHKSVFLFRHYSIFSNVNCKHDSNNHAMLNCWMYHNEYSFHRNVCISSHVSFLHFFLAYSLMGLRLCSRHLLPEYQLTHIPSTGGNNNNGPDVNQSSSGNSSWQVLCHTINIYLTIISQHVCHRM